MELEFQKDALEYLKILSDKDIHSIMITGLEGTGKSYLSSRFAKLKNIYTFQIVECKMESMKQLIYDSLSLNEPQVICIRDLDKGMALTSQTILKYLEEPKSNVYVIVTSSIPSKLPQTILSRVVQVTMKHPEIEDLKKFAKSLNVSSSILKSLDDPTFKDCFKSLKDIQNLKSMNLDQLNYYRNLCTDKFWNQSIDQIIWNLGHFEDKSSTDLKFVLRVLYNYFVEDRDIILNAMLDFESNRLSQMAVFGALAINLKRR